MSLSMSNSSYEPYAFGIPSSAANRRALSRFRDASAVTSHQAPCCIAGITFLTAMFAAPKTPHLTLSFISVSKTLRWSKIAGSGHSAVNHQFLQHDARIQRPKLQDMNTGPAEFVLRSHDPNAIFHRTLPLRLRIVSVKIHDLW